MLLASVLMGARRSATQRRSQKAPALSTARRILPGAAALSALLLAPLHPAHASASSAAQAYSKGDFIAAENAYATAAQRNPKAPAFQYNLGTAAYRVGQYPEAAAAFEASLKGTQSADPKRLAEQENTYYNLGDTLYRAGQKTEQSSPEQTIQTWTAALKAYDAALQLRASDADGKFNRDLVMRKLDELKQKQKQKQKQSQQNQQNKQSQPGGKSEQKQQAQNQQNQQNQQTKQGQQDKDSKQAQNSSGHQNSQPSGDTKSQEQTQQPSRPLDRPSQSVTGQPPDGKPAKGGAEERQDQKLADSQPESGQMSRDEARELLDSVKDEQHRYPAASLANSAVNSPSADQPTKDW